MPLAKSLRGILAFPLRASDLKVVCRQDDNRRGFCFVDNSYIIAKKMFSLFRLRVSVVGCNALKYSVFATDTPVAGCRWGGESILLYWESFAEV